MGDSDSGVQPLQTLGARVWAKLRHSEAPSAHGKRLPVSLQIKMWKELEDQRQREELDPAKEAGSTIFELNGSDPRVQRLQALGAQVQAHAFSVS